MVDRCDPSFFRPVRPYSVLQPGTTPPRGSHDSIVHQRRHGPPPDVSATTVTCLLACHQRSAGGNRPQEEPRHAAVRNVPGVGRSGGPSRSSSTSTRSSWRSSKRPRRWASSPEPARGRGGGGRDARRRRRTEWYRAPDKGQGLLRSRASDWAGYCVAISVAHSTPRWRRGALLSSRGHPASSLLINAPAKAVSYAELISRHRAQVRWGTLQSAIVNICCRWAEGLVVSLGGHRGERTQARCLG